MSPLWPTKAYFHCYSSVANESRTTHIRVCVALAKATIPTIY